MKQQLQPVIWSKGTFLTPQHLQVQERFLENVLQFRLHALSFKPWGFTALRIDESRLEKGTFTLSQAAGILPDGVLFEMPGCDPLPASRDIIPLFAADQKSIDVYLVLREYQEKIANVARSPEEGTRFLSVATNIRDENTGSNERPIQTARKNFRLLLGSESRAGMSVLRVARVVRTAPENFELAAHFAPPLLNSSASTFVVGILRGIVELLSAKSTTLSTVRRQRNRTSADFTELDVPTFWLLYTVNSYFPLFNHLLNTRKAHPEEVYAAMASLAGALMTFSLEMHPRDIPPYNHEELGTCFHDLEQMIRMLLQKVVRSNVISLKLNQTQPSIYMTPLTDDKYFANARLYLAVAAEVTEAELIRRVPQTVAVSSTNYIDGLVRQSLLGAALTHVPSPPRAIPVRVDYQYFSLSQSGSSWESIVRGRSLAAHVPSEFRNPQLELLILLPEEAK